jgi:Glycosyl hydrolases family 16
MDLPGLAVQGGPGSSTWDHRSVTQDRHHIVHLDRSGYELEVEDFFEGPDLDRRLWLPAYLPHWSSREAARARFHVGDGLDLLIEADQGPWCREFDGSTRSSTLQTGTFAGPTGGTVGQHRFRAGLVVRQEQPALALYTPTYGLFETRARALGDPSCMVALWMIGYEDEPSHSAEILIFEIFGRDVAPDRALVGMGVHPFGDPAIRDEFERVPVRIDVREAHDYAAEWTPERVTFYVDEQLVKVVEQSPTYPMQFMLSIYEFGDGPRAPSFDEPYPKAFRVEWFRAYRPVSGHGSPTRR